MFADMTEFEFTKTGLCRERYGILLHKKHKIAHIK